MAKNLVPPPPPTHTLPDVRHYCKLSLYAISRKTNEPNAKNCKKKLVTGLILAHLDQIQAARFFFKNVSWSVTRYHGQLSSFTISQKTNDPILRKLSDGWTIRPGRLIS